MAPALALALALSLYGAMVLLIGPKTWPLLALVLALALLLALLCCFRLRRRYWLVTWLLVY